MERWNWFTAANSSGKWIITSGYADVSHSEKQFEALLQFAPDADRTLA